MLTPMTKSITAIGSTVLFAALALLSSVAAAQAQPAPEGDLPPAPPPAPGASAAAPAEAACTPACRAGFMCRAGQCVSACNPPCSAGQQCTATGECTAAAGPAPSTPVFPNTPEATIEPPPDRGAERHDGFMLRLTLGFGGASMKEKLDASVLSATSMEISGFSGTFSFDIGAALTDGLVLHARLSDFVMTSPSVKVNGMTLGSANNSTFGAILFGPALTYYFMPINLYLTAAVGGSWLNVQNRNGDSATSGGGLGLNFDLGKEWWVSDNWGLGVALRFWYSHVSGKDSSIGYSDNFLGYGIVFSATYQ
jgi:hypothetical protein